VPKFLHSRHGITLDQVGLPLVVIYLRRMPAACSEGGSRRPDPARLLGQRGRKLAILASALMVAPIMFAPRFRACGEQWRC